MQQKLLQKKKIINKSRDGINVTIQTVQQKFTKKTKQMKSDVFGLQRKVNRPKDFKLDMNDRYYKGRQF